MHKRRNNTALFLGLALCAAQTGYAADTANSFKYGEDKAPSTLNPAFANTMTDTRIEELLFESLFTYDRFLKPVPQLAADWKPNADKTEATVFLRQAVWHDGKPVTAGDVAFTVRALQDQRSGAPGRSSVALIKKVEVRSPTEAHLVFTQALVQPERAMMFKVLPKHKFSKLPLKRRDRFRMNPVGSGPFKFEKWEGTTVELTRNHHQQLAIDKIVARFIPDKKVQLDFLQFDALDAIVRVLPRHRAVVEGMAGKVALMPYESLSWWYLGINHAHPHLKNSAVRQALVAALNRDEIRTAHLGDGQTISGPFAPRSPFYNDKVRPHVANKRNVRRLMRRAGYGTSGGVFSKGGSKLKLRLAINKNWAAYKDVCLDIQTRLRKAGFLVTLDWVEGASWREKVVKKKDYDLTIGAWSFDESSDVFDLFHSRGVHNYFNYSSERMDALLQQSRSTKDPELFKELYFRVHEHAHADLPYIFLWSVQSYTAVTTKMTGVDIHPFRYFTWIKEWKWKK